MSGISLRSEQDPGRVLIRPVRSWRSSPKPVAHDSLETILNALIILNPSAGSGQALKRFHAIEPLLPDLLGDYLLAVTHQPEEIGDHLHLAAEAGYDTIVSVGGDGTNQAIVNALASNPEYGFTLATLPFGTGRDWARTLGIPLEPEAAFRWLSRAVPRAVDVGQVTANGKSHRFLNVASAGISGEVSRKVNASRVKRPWTFLQHVVSTLLRFDAPSMRIHLDGEYFYEGDAFIVAIGNGRFFARGMMIAPNALINDGLFDVILVEGIRKAEILSALPTVFRGTHIRRDDVHERRARHVHVEAQGPIMGMDLDGEPYEGLSIDFDILPGAVTMLVDPASDALLKGL